MEASEALIPRYLDKNKLLKLSISECRDVNVINGDFLN